MDKQTEQMREMLVAVLQDDALRRYFGPVGAAMP